MLRLGSAPSQSREMDLDDIFFSRLKLLLIMAKSYLDEHPLGALQRQAVLENARHVETESIELGKSTFTLSAKSESDEQTELDHVFYQRVKLMSVMMQAVAKGFPIGDSRKNAMRENLQIICRTDMISSQTDYMGLLKVA